MEGDNLHQIWRDWLLQFIRMTYAVGSWCGSSSTTTPICLSRRIFAALRPNVEFREHTEHQQYNDSHFPNFMVNTTCSNYRPSSWGSKGGKTVSLHWRPRLSSGSRGRVDNRKWNPDTSIKSKGGITPLDSKISENSEHHGYSSHFLQTTLFLIPQTQILCQKISPSYWLP